MIDEQTLNELNVKLELIIDYLINNHGHEYELYSYCPMFEDHGPDSDIVEFAKDVKRVINKLNEEDDYFPF